MTTTSELFKEAQDLFVHGHLRESLAGFDRAEAAGFDPIVSALSRGAAYLRLGEYEGAIHELDSVVARQPNHDRALYYRGLVWLNSGDPKRAVEDLSRSITINPTRAPAFLARGIARSELGQDEGAVNDFKAAVAHSTAEVEEFTSLLGSHRTLFERSMALLEGERGPHKIVLTPEEVERLKGWLEE
ncbi:MAG: tetratricopeptide repeat protein [Thermodesulfobacteriota bacterium]